MTPILRCDPRLGVEYVEVIDEPHHVEQFRNAHTRVYLATLDPGACTLYHRHRVDTLYIVMSEGSSRSEEPGHQTRRTRVGRSIPIWKKLSWWVKRARTRSLRLPTGTVFMQYHAEFPLTHRLCAASADDRPIRMLGVELPTDPHLPPGRPPPLAALPVEYHDGHATVYRIKLTQGQRTDPIRPRRPSLLIIVSGTPQRLSATTTSALTSGDVHWLDTEDDFELANPKNLIVHALLIVLRDGRR